MTPILPQWLRQYRRPQLGGDLIAALVVTMLLVPQGLAYAALAGLPPQLGLYASLLPLVAYAFFGSSMVVSVGPVAVAALMTAAALAPIAEAGSPEYIAAAIMLALLTGLMLFAFGLLRLGAMAQFLSHPVISGFISGAALLIIIGQLRPLLGIQAEGETAITLLTSLIAGLDNLHPLTTIVGLGALTVLALARYYLARLLGAVGLSAPIAGLLAKLAPMVVVLTSILLVGAMGWYTELNVVGELPAGLPSLVVPSFDLGLIGLLWLPALVIGLISFVESVALAQAFASKNRQRVDANAELRGLGAANMASAFSGGFPVAGGFSRTAVNADAGARTPLSGAFAALLIALVLVFATGLFRHLPMAVLAATIIIAAVGLVDIKSLRHTWHYDRAEGLAQLGTLFGVVIAGIETGIAIGIALSLATLVWRASRPHIAQLGRVPGTEHFRNINRYQVETRPEIIMLRIDERLFFGNAEAVEKSILDSMDAQADACHLVLVLSSVSSIDATALDMLDQLNTRLLDQGMQLHFAEVKGPVMEQLEHSGFEKRLGGSIFLSANEAFEALQ